MNLSSAESGGVIPAATWRAGSSCSRRLQPSHAGSARRPAEGQQTRVHRVGGVCAARPVAVCDRKGGARRRREHRCHPTRSGDPVSFRIQSQSARATDDSDDPREANSRPRLLPDLAAHVSGSGVMAASAPRRQASASTPARTLSEVQQSSERSPRHSDARRHRAASGPTHRVPAYRCTGNPCARRKVA